MRTEVEIKAWVGDLEGLRAQVAELYPHAGSYTKEDVYYRLVGSESGVEFRLRIEGGSSTVTAKRKSTVNGVEINEEMEFAVSDSEEFERFARYLGARIFAHKRKSGDRYRAGDATIELSHVERLGDFIEVERLVEGTAPQEIRSAEATVRSILKGFSITDDKIEPRYYIDLLADLER